MWSQDFTPKKRWSEEKTMSFVRDYRSNDCLWDVQHKYYKNRSIREMVCCKMAEKFNCTPDDVRKKIKSLRGAYCHERNKIKDSIETGFDVAHVYLPSVVWYDEMDAVMNGGGCEVENPTEPIENIDNEYQSGDDDNKQLVKKDDCSSNNDNSDDEQASETSQDHSVKVVKCSPQPSGRLNNSETGLHKLSNNSLSIVRKKRKDQTHNLLAAVDKLHSISTASAGQMVQENEFDLFGRCVAQQLKNFKDIKVALRIQHRIQGILTEERIQEMANTKL